MTIYKFVRNLVIDPRGRSLREILADPTFSDEYQENAQLPRPIPRKKSRRKRQISLRPLAIMHERHLVLTNVVNMRGSPIQEGSSSSPTLANDINEASKQAWDTMAPWAFFPYEYARKAIRKPPDWSLWTLMINLSMVFYIFARISWSLLCIRYRPRIWLIEKATSIASLANNIPLINRMTKISSDDEKRGSSELSRRRKRKRSPAKKRKSSRSKRVL